MTTMPPFRISLARTPLILALMLGHGTRPCRRRQHQRTTGQPTLAPVHVKADRLHGYNADNSQMDTFGSFGNAPLQDTPAAIPTVITRDQIDDRQPRTLSELARSDAALGDSYAPVGYYQDIAIRGYSAGSDLFCDLLFSSN